MRIDRFIFCSEGYYRNYNMAHKDVSGLNYMPEGLENVSFFTEESK